MALACQEGSQGMRATLSDAAAILLDPCSHVNAETPGSIHEGGELGYALSVAFGAVMDKPDLVCVCVIGDGEAETGPTATYVVPRILCPTFLTVC